MRIAVVGVGGVGGYFGGMLAKSGADVTFIARGKTLDALRTRGLRVDSINGDFVLDRVQATDKPEGTFDAILMAVKAWQLADAASPLRANIGDETAVVPFENGIDAPEVLADLVGREHVLGGLSAIVSYIVEPGHVKHAASEPIVMFGELDNRPSERTERLRELFVNAGVNASIPPDIHHSMWSKFLFITPLSGIGALTRVPVGVWRAIPEVRAVVDASLREIVAIARARGIDLGGDEAVTRTWSRYDGLAPSSTSSFQRDIQDGKPSELEAQLGAAVRLARDSGVPVPVTEMMYHLLLPQERVARENAPS